MSIKITDNVLFLRDKTGEIKPVGMFGSGADKILNEAKSYTDNALDEAKNYTDNVTNEAKSYTDNTLNEAKSYTDNITNEAKSYTDNIVNEINIKMQEISANTLEDYTALSNSITQLNENLNTVLNRLTVVERKPSIKILGIGNSYTDDSMRWLQAILEDAGYDAVVGYVCKGSATLQQQYEYLKTDFVYPYYYKYPDHRPDRYHKALIFENSHTLTNVINDEDWDVVVFQQQSDESGQYNSFVNDNFDIKEFVSVVKTIIGNNNLKIGLNCTWSHPNSYDGSLFSQYYNRDGEKHYNAVQATIQKVANYIGDIDFIINTGKAVKLARNNEYLGSLGYEFTRDHNHLCYGIGQFLAGFCYANVICGVRSNDITFYPKPSDSIYIEDDSLTKYLHFIAKQCAVGGQSIK